MAIPAEELRWYAARGSTKGATLTIFRRRSQREPEDAADIQLSRELRIQIVHILREALGEAYEPYVGENPVWAFAYHQMLKELGRYKLSDRVRDDDPDRQCIAFIEDASDIEAADLVDMLFIGLTAYYESKYDAWSLLRENWRAGTRATDAIDELNDRLRAADVPLRFTGDKLVRVDSDYLHRDVTAPAFGLLREDEFRGAETEFRAAHDHFRHGSWDSAVSEANQAVESVMKQLLDLQQTPYDSGDASTVLARRLVDSRMFAHADEEYRNKLHAALANKLPPVRNALDHGAGVDPREADEAIASFALHLAASDIVFLISTWRLRATR